MIALFRWLWPAAIAAGFVVATAAPTTLAISGSLHVRVRGASSSLLTEQAGAAADALAASPTAVDHSYAVRPSEHRRRRRRASSDSSRLWQPMEAVASINMLVSRAAHGAQYFLRTNCSFRRPRSDVTMAMSESHTTRETDTLN